MKSKHRSAASKAVLTLPIIILILVVFAAVYYAGPSSGSVNCPPQGVTLSVSPPAVGEGMGFSASGHTYPQSGVCSQVGATVYFQYIDPTTGVAQRQSVSSDPNNGNYNYQWAAPGDYLGVLQIQASLCSFTSAGRAQCTNNGYNDAFASLSVVSNPPQTYNLATYFLYNGQGIAGVAGTLIQNGNFIQTLTSNANGEVFFQNVPGGTGYTISYQPNGFNNGVYGPFTVSSNMNLNIPLSVVCGGTTTTTIYGSTTIFNQVYCSTATTSSTFTITSDTSTSSSTSSSSYSTQSGGSTSVGPKQNNWIAVSLPTSGTLWVSFSTGGAGIKLWILTSNQFGQFEQTCGQGLLNQCSAPGGDLVGTGVASSGNYSATISGAGTYYIDFDASGCFLNCLLSQTVTYQYGFASTQCLILCSITQGLSTTELILIGVAVIVVIGIAVRRG